MATKKQLFDEMYSSLGILNVPLEKKCKFCYDCWQGAEDRMWHDDFEGEDDEEHCSHIYLPWIGNKYDELKLLILGINMNEYGGYYAESSLVGGAIRELSMGRRKINFNNPNYGGTFFWHRVPAYAVLFAELLAKIEATWCNDGFPSKEDLVKVFDYISITNQIKCSPIGKKSEPTYQMWEKCGNFILKEEIRILDPSYILICGNNSNAGFFNNKVLDKPIEDLKSFGYAQSGIGLLDGKAIQICIVPHPTSYGGNNSEILFSLKGAIQQAKFSN